MAAESGWNEPSLKAVFRQGLNSDVLTKLVFRDDKATLDSLIHLAIRLDSLFQDRRRWPKTSALPGVSVPEPMQFGNTHLANLEHFCDIGKMASVTTVAMITISSHSTVNEGASDHQRGSFLSRNLCGE